MSTALGPSPIRRDIHLLRLRLYARHVVKVVNNHGGGDRIVRVRDVGARDVLRGRYRGRGSAYFARLGDEKSRVKLVHNRPVEVHEISDRLVRRLDLHLPRSVRYLDGDNTHSTSRANGCKNNLSIGYGLSERHGRLFLPLMQHCSLNCMCTCLSHTLTMSLLEYSANSVSPC